MSNCRCRRATRVPKPTNVAGADCSPWEDCYYGGYGPRLAAALAHAGHGGQVVVNQRAWKQAQDRLPGRCQVGFQASSACVRACVHPVLLAISRSPWHMRRR